MKEYRLQPIPKGPRSRPSVELCCEVLAWLETLPEVIALKEQKERDLQRWEATEYDGDDPC